MRPSRQIRLWLIKRRFSRLLAADVRRWMDASPSSATSPGEGQGDGRDK